MCLYCVFVCVGVLVYVTSPVYMLVRVGQISYSMTTASIIRCRKEFFALSDMVAAYSEGWAGPYSKGRNTAGWDPWEALSPGTRNIFSHRDDGIYSYIIQIYILNKKKKIHLTPPPTTIKTFKNRFKKKKKA